MQELECGEIKPEELEAVVQLAVEVFMEDSYFVEHWPDSQERYRRLAQIYREGITICGENFGGTLVARQGEMAVGFLMYFDYKKFRRCNLKAFKQVFGVEIAHNRVQPDSFVKIHREAMSISESPVYVLAVGVGKNSQNQGIGRGLFVHFLTKFNGRPIMSDISGPFFLRLCQKFGFEVRPLTNICCLAVKRRQGQSWGEKTKND